ncbi:MAG: tail fiber domain-containing protein [Verrucomicrobiales bacterium]|nr:tail fiber domain-containing protein [Verrucomicrobiales bacterium]
MNTKLRSRMNKSHSTPLPVCARRLAMFAVSACAFAFSLVVARSAASPPDRMSYQGFLVDGSGNALAPTTPVNYPVVFRIYDEMDGGNLIWAEQQVVTVDKGNFSVILGEGAAVTSEPHDALSTVFAGNTSTTRYMGTTVTVGASTFTLLPRLRLLPSPYAFTASQATQLINSSTGSPYVSLGGGGIVEIAGAINASGGLTGLTSAQVPDILSGTRTFNGPVRINGANTLEFGADVAPKEVNNGKIGYGAFTAGVLDIVGAGASVDARRIRFHAQGGSDFIGNVGIGTFGGGHRLEVAGGDNVAWFSSSGGNAYLRVSDNTGFDNRVEFASRGNGRAAIWTGGDHLNVLRNGNVGVGTTTPATTLDVNSAGTWRPLAVRGNGGTDMIVAGNLSGRASIGGHNGAGNAWAHMSLNPGGGRVGIGTLSPDTVLTLSANTPESRMRIYNQFGLGDFGRENNFAFVGLNNSVHTTAYRFASYDGDSNWDFNSDRKLKKDIVEAEPMLERALKVQVRRYRWNEDEPNATHKLGVIAQEVQPLFPEMVSEVGHPEKPGEKMLTVGYGDFGVIAIKAIQELNKIVESKDARINALESELAALKKLIAANQNASAQWEARFAALERLVAGSAPAASSTAPVAAR